MTTASATTDPRPAGLDESVNADMAERAVLEAADHLFAAHGVTAVTMAAIRDRSGVSMRRLYATFGDKSDLVARWLTDRDGRWLARFGASVDEAVAAGTSPIDAVFDVLGSHLAADDFRGCAFLRTLAELSELPPRTRQIIVDHKAAFAAQLDGRLGLGADVALLVDGAITHSVLRRDLSAIEGARRLSHQLAASAATATPTARKDTP